MLSDDLTRPVKTMLIERKNAARDIFLIRSTQNKNATVINKMYKPNHDGCRIKASMGTHATASMTKNRAECAALLQWYRPTAI
jgi:hypothetical protein